MRNMERRRSKSQVLSDFQSFTKELRSGELQTLLQKESLLKLRSTVLCGEGMKLHVFWHSCGFLMQR